MTDDSPTPALRGRVSRATAAQILEQAANLDAVGDEMMELEELRQAALDAGISERAFDLSLAELRNRRTAAEAPIPPSSGPPSVPPATAATPRRVSYMGVIGVGAISGTLAIFGTALLAGGYVPPDVASGAGIAGSGAIAGILAYLRATVGRGKPD